MALLANVAGCGDDPLPPDTSSGTPTSSGTGGRGGEGGGQGGQGATGGQGGQGGQGGGVGGQGGQGGGVGGQGGTGGGPGCTAGETKACYTGPMGTQGVGICGPGLQTCGPDGTFGPCAGDTVPAAETCGNGVDEDCNGMVDDGASCVCTPGQTQACYSGPDGTENVGLCKGGMTTCSPDGSGYGPCVGEVLPTAETCNAIDDDCDGTADDGVASCVCMPGQTQVCYSGPSGTQGVGLCKGGTQTCLPDGSGFGLCMGEVLPSPENCATAGDDDCNGMAPACTGSSVFGAGYGDTLVQMGTAVAADAQGNIYVAGNFQGSMDFGAPVGVLTSTGGNDAFLVKLDPTGKAIWAKKYGDNTEQIINAIAVDGNGDVVITGQFQGKISFGSGTFTSLGLDDVFVARIDKDGNQIQATSFGNSVTNVGSGVGVDAQGNVYLTGWFSGNITNLPGAFQLASVNQLEAFLIKLAPDLQNTLWAKAFNGNGNQFGYKVAVTPTGNVSFVGSFEGSIDFGGGALQSAGSHDIVVSRYDSFGSHLWSKRVGDAVEQRALAVAVDNMGNTFATGQFAGTVTFGGSNFTSGGGDDGFVVKYDATGNHVYSMSFGGVSAQRGRGIATDVFGNAVVTGEFWATANFGGGTLVSAGKHDIFVFKLDPTGKHTWSKKFGGGEIESGASVAVDGSSNVVVTGTLQSQTSFGVGAPVTVSPVGVDNMFVLKLAP
ncbi:MopE-related protein [Polyangium aurulentum]|uniref:MopE-related protein n=1 Tax=Polyangium aurulentum TaxID=2567896 RepID=UPI00146E1E3F|nr:MopE-related protein [Polyangium aurulentum]UQA56674.1 hypothetical protein E8A73_036020 [Polyangium aurulentum]